VLVFSPSDCNRRDRSVQWHELSAWWHVDGGRRYLHDGSPEVCISLACGTSSVESVR
jgi:hypothetical protein